MTLSADLVCRGITSLGNTHVANLTSDDGAVSVSVTVVGEPRPRYVVDGTYHVTLGATGVTPDNSQPIPADLPPAAPAPAAPAEQVEAPAAYAPPPAGRYPADDSGEQPPAPEA